MVKKYPKQRQNLQYQKKHLLLYLYPHNQHNYQHSHLPFHYLVNHIRHRFLVHLYHLLHIQAKDHHHQHQHHQEAVAVIVVVGNEFTMIIKIVALWIS